MSELQWKKKNSHDYVSNAVELLGEFNTFKSAYAKMLIDSGAYYCYTIDRR